MVGRWTSGVILALADPTAAYAFLTALYAISLASSLLTRVPGAHRRPAKPIAEAQRGNAVAWPS